MNTVDGYAMSSLGHAATATSRWCPTSRTLRRVPWQPGTALVLADLALARRLAGDVRLARGRSCAGSSTGSPSTA